MALLTFRRRCEISVLEVGLGGRLDATNVIAPELCVITPIAFDHESFLGNTLEAIALEKAGISEAGCYGRGRETTRNCRGRDFAARSSAELRRDSH